MKVTPQQVREASKDPLILVQLSIEDQNLIRAAEIIGREEDLNPKKKKSCKSCKKGGTGLNIPFYKELYKKNKDIFDTYYAKRNLQ